MADTSSEKAEKSQVEANTDVVASERSDVAFNSARDDDPEEKVSWSTIMAIFVGPTFSFDSTFPNEFTLIIYLCLSSWECPTLQQSPAVLFW